MRCRSPASDGDSIASTMGSMANGRHTIVVGAVERDEHDRQRHVMGEYSSTGRRVDGFAFGKLDGAGFLTGSRKQLAGTSVAAALVTGTAAALALCGKSPPTDRGALLQALRRLASGRTPKLPGEAGGALSLPNQKGFVLPPGPGVETEPG